MMQKLSQQVVLKSPQFKRTRVDRASSASVLKYLFCLTSLACLIINTLPGTLHSASTIESRDDTYLTMHEVTCLVISHNFPCCG
jgi:hypothetical protein